ncbi:PilA pilus assembly protein [Marinicauda pacifica]|jgi:pilus assembly protein Flp/PilA|uniref:Flp family type IVb pilin n=1 Tax=Marinicauda pacifica TaxID=1133559 RepID=A0A4S2HAF1_9PROT|nr:MULTISPECIES: Flp family type IVb pilin [Marinicauda]TGY92856.1 Flp family type IVb pilin [Marinicauda pacifica]GGE40909.1 PilA pilus assembly protein [Marinicauda pacifica]
MKTLFSRFMNDESGATAIEYGLIAALIGVGLVAILGTLSGSLEGVFQGAADELDSAL